MPAAVHVTGPEDLLLTLKYGPVELAAKTGFGSKAR